MLGVEALGIPGELVYWFTKEVVVPIPFLLGLLGIANFVSEKKIQVFSMFRDGTILFFCFGLVAALFADAVRGLYIDATNRRTIFAIVVAFLCALGSSFCYGATLTALTNCTDSNKAAISKKAQSISLFTLFISLMACAGTRTWASLYG